MSKTLRLNQVIAIEKGTKTKAAKEATEAYHQLQKNDLLVGLSRKYRPKDDDGDKLPDEGSRVQVRVEDVLSRVGEVLTELFDITATKDYANSSAVADVVVDGTVLIEKAPVTYLLFLEKELVSLHTQVMKLPTLDPASEWSYDPVADCMKTPAVDTTKTKKVLKNHVKAEATDKHPAQVESFSEDVIVGYWSSIKFSGALPASRAKTLLNRVEALQKAVKIAREHANMLEVQQKNVGSAVFSYLFSK